jgi:hypothetical protein
MKDVFTRAAGTDNYQCKFYPGGHKFDLQMQADAFAWFDKYLKAK